MNDQRNTLWERGKEWLSTAANLLTVVPVVFTGVAAVTSYQLNAAGLARLFLILFIASTAAFLIRKLSSVMRWCRYKFLARTTVVLYGGDSLTLVIEHEGPPVKVRARAMFAEFGDEMESDPAPYDLTLFTRVSGGRYELIELNDSFPMAKSIFGQLEKLSDKASQLTVERPGLSPLVGVAQESSSVLAYLNITVRVVTPVGVQDIEKKYRLYVVPERIKVVDDGGA